MMKASKDYNNKIDDILASLPTFQLSEEDIKYLRKISLSYRFTFQEVRKIIDICSDFKMWQIGEIREHLFETDNVENLKQTKKKVLNELETKWLLLKNSKKSYDQFDRSIGERPNKISEIQFQSSTKPLDTTILGKCPVASEKTLCCNLETLDAVNNCGFECSYCSIQSFFPDNTILYEDKLKDKLDRLTIDPDKNYHIGTGQSSDSLMWGNKGGILDHLMEFARKHPNVILEFKTKSKNISYFLNNEIPPNIICTWSLNPQVIIDNEEHHTASLEERIKCAKSLASKGILVGFHLHPIIFYDNFEDDYSDLATRLMEEFDPSQIAMISLGTLTFTKPVLKEIRRKKIYSKILQMPLVEASGKYSYPDDTKVYIFKHVFNSFKAWHGEIFFYLCMELKEYWPKVFGYEFETNLDFENAMKDNYLQKIKNSPHLMI